MTACTGSPEATSPTSASAAPSPTATGEKPGLPSDVLDPEGSAEANLAAFTKVVNTVWGGAKKAEGIAYIDALVAAGFGKKSDMQVTADFQGIGEPAESIIFSVLWKDSCLIGQVGPSTGDPVTKAMTPTADGVCLIGETEPLGL